MILPLPGPAVRAGLAALVAQIQSLGPCPGHSLPRPDPPRRRQRPALRRPGRRVRGPVRDGTVVTIPDSGHNIQATIRPGCWPRSGPSSTSTRRRWPAELTPVPHQHPARSHIRFAAPLAPRILAFRLADEFITTIRCLTCQDVGRPELRHNEPSARAQIGVIDYLALPPSWRKT